MGRYDRQLIEFSQEEQARISKSTVGLVGCGGLGTSVSTALSMAGVGKLKIMDSDVPDITNLNRQFIYCETVLSGEEPHPKADIMAEWIHKLNPDVDVVAKRSRFDEITWDFYDDCDVIVDCLDSIRYRLLVNKYCVEKGKPLVHGGISGFTGQLMTMIPGRTPCLNCILGSVPESSTPPASLGAIVMTIGSLEASEVLKLLIGRENDSAGIFNSFNFYSVRHTPISFERDPNCPICRHLYEK